MTVPVGPDPSWPGVFAVERDALVATLKPWLVKDVHHIGSTAVPDMPAKPIIDMIAGIGRLADADDAEPALLRLGYVRRPHRVDAARFIKAVAGQPDVHTHHLHLTVPGSDLWQERLAFRDALRRDPALVERYARLKAQLLERSGGGPYSAVDKRDFVREVLAGAGIVLRDDRHVRS